MPRSHKSTLARSMSDTHQCVNVDLGDRSYKIQIEPKSLAKLGTSVAKALGPAPMNGTAIVVTNPKVDLYHGAEAFQSLRDNGYQVIPVMLPAGESYKTLNAVRRIYKALNDAAVDRHGLVVALGGGVIGDVAGFAAATYNRGISLVQVPTTLLAQVDSSVGGKTGVNFGRGKNLIGSFYQPQLVAIDTDTLSTLPWRERRSGLVEMVKYGIIYDAEFFKLLSNEIKRLLRLSSDMMAYCIARSCEIKGLIVEADEHEHGMRAILNFGHTIGHALEAITQYRVYRHGEAIAIGSISACMIGEELGITNPADTAAVMRLYRDADFPINLDERLPLDGLLELLAWDKKSVGGTARFVLMHEIGKVSAGHEVPLEVIRRALIRQRDVF